MTSPEGGKFSEIFNAQTNETSDEKHSLQIHLSLIHVDKEDTASTSGISEVLKAAKEPQAQTLKHDLEIPPQVKITSIPLSSFPRKLQQLMLARAKNVSKVKQTTEILTVTYIWPVIKVEEASRPFWDNFLNFLIETKKNLTRHTSSPEVVIEDVKCSQRTPVEQLAQEELDRKTATSYRLILKSYNSFVSGILKSLSSNNDKDYKNMIPLSSISPIGMQRIIPLFKGNALVIYDEQVYLLYVMRHEALSSEMETFGHHMLIRMTTVSLLTCSDIREVRTKVSQPLLRGQYALKDNIQYLTALATATDQDKTSNATHVSSDKMTTISQPKQCSPSTGKIQQFLNKTAFPPKEDLQNRNDKEALEEKYNELRKKFGIVKDLRVRLNRINVSLSTAHRVITSEVEKILPLELVLPKRRKVTRKIRVISKKRNKGEHSHLRCSTAETMKRVGEITLCSSCESPKKTTLGDRPSFGKCTEQTLCIQDNPDEVSQSKTLFSD